MKRLAQPAGTQDENVCQSVVELRIPERREVGKVDGIVDDDAGTCSIVVVTIRHAESTTELIWLSK